MRILVTGGNGFIGSHFADAAIEEGHECVLMDLGFGKNTTDLSCLKLVGDVAIRESFVIG